MWWLIVAVLAAAFFFWMKKNPKTAQDAIGQVEISTDGLIKTKNVFRRVIEVQLANLDTVSKTEQQQVWTSFFSLVNTVGIPYSLIVQSQHLEVKDYTQYYGQQVMTNELTPELRESGNLVKKYVEESTQEFKVRDYRGLIFLQYDPLAASIDSGVPTGLGALDSLLNKADNSGTKMSAAEKADIAGQILQEAAEEIFSFCDHVGMGYQLLDRAGVLNTNYQTLQRELGPHARMADAMKQQAFHPHKRSITEWREGFQ